MFASAKIHAMVASALLASLAGCGGGGDDDDEDDDEVVPVGPGWSAPPPPPTTPTTGATVDGVFRDAVVEGLDYSDGGALTGITGANGRFQYAQGNLVTFRIGGLTLGGLQGQPYMSPLHVVSGTTNLTQQINNRARLLQMLDRDGNPENGILISNAVRAVAANWTAPDFSLGYPEFAAAVQPLVQAATQADGVTHVLPSEVNAEAHFARTARCTYSGLYRGTYTGSGDSGTWAMVSYGSGQIFGGGYSNVDRAGFGLEKQSALQLSIFPAFVATTSGVTFSGSYRTPNSVTGTWTNAPDNGTFVGGRSGGSDTAVYRISGYQFPLGTALLMSFEVDAANQITGQVIDRDFMRTGDPVALTGTLAGTAFSAAAAGSQYTVTGTFDRNALPTALRLTGTLRDNIKARDVNLSLSGCRLN
jgi:hypothetical protein